MAVLLLDAAAVMAGLDPAIHVLLAAKKDGYARPGKGAQAGSSFNLSEDAPLLADERYAVKDYILLVEGAGRQ